MNTVAQYLTRHWDRLSLNRFGPPSHLSYLLLTPRFRASRHVVFLVLANGSPEPTLVAKVPRLRGDFSFLHREVANLRAVHAARTGGFDSIPRVVAYEEHEGNQLLLESALVGQPMNPSLVQRQPTSCIEVTMNWLLSFNEATSDRSQEPQDSFQRLVDQPLAQLESLFLLMADEEGLLEKTRELTSPLRHTRFPLVFEHGDLSAPNLLILKDGSLGVLDWEMAEPTGLPAVDLFFFLTFVAFARRRAQKEGAYLASFHQAFFGSGAWARPYVTRYAERLQVSPQVMGALFVLCWSRYISNLAALLRGSGPAPGAVLEEETANWLRQNRYFSLWRHTLEHVGNLNLIK